MTERKSQADASDLLVMLGLLLLGVALWIVWGAAAVIAYAGTLLLIAGVASSMQRSRKL